MFAKVALCALGVALLLSVASAQENVARECLGCMCEASTECNTKQACTSAYCGPFLISWAYWDDAGRPVTTHSNPGDNDAYVKCVSDLYCASTAINNYMNKYRKDCNNDGRITCADYALIHKLGPHNCGGNPSSDYWNLYSRCAQALNLV